MYGTEVIDIGKKETQGMEVIQNKVARTALGTNKYVAVEVLRGEMGWSSFEERLDKTKMKYFVRLQFMNENRWTKKIYYWNKNVCTVVKEYRDRMLKLHMHIWKQQDEVRLAIEGEEFIEGERQMNRKIKKNIENKGLEKWKQNMQQKRSLRWYKEKEKPKMVNIYNGSWESALLFKMKSDSLEINSRRGRWGIVRNDKCEACLQNGLQIEETLEHLLMECSQYNIERAELEGEIIEEIGEESWRQAKDKESKGIDIILNINNESNKMERITKKYIGEIWKKRNKAEWRSIQEQGDHTYTLPAIG